MTAIKPYHEKVCDVIIPKFGGGLGGPGILRVFGTREELLTDWSRQLEFGLDWIVLQALDPTSADTGYCTRIDIKYHDISMIVSERDTADVLNVMLKDPEVIASATEKYNHKAGPANKVQGIVAVEQDLEEPNEDN